MKRFGLSLASALLILSLATACWGADEPEAQEAASGKEAGGIISLDGIFGTERFDKPIGLENRAGYSDLVYIVEQPGRIVSKDLKQPAAKPEVVLDIADRVYDVEGEQGLLGLAFHPKHPNQAYVNYTTETHTVIARYDTLPANDRLLDPASERILLTFEQPFANHNGGQLGFGPDGYLYIATGDGGSGGDPLNNSQNLDSLLGKILRIDVDGHSEERAYAIPADNPFLDNGKPEIYAYGLRNPWRFSFDEETGKLWVADVGQSRYEEINLVEKGKNYGWRIQEGTECYNPENGCEQQGLELPIFTYGRDQGVSVTGGYVYRGDRIPELVGWYVYADYGSGLVWALRLDASGKVENRLLLETETNITSFGEDGEGELYICTQEGEVLAIF
ncbi:PQQ-dependent sugar dehydrogenase [Cohnella cholangitidis]|uniref:PQQ-dependent sugar dehydrogenase n=1 Tax=Cohnella cholangitidis TaxID=2598458 RepID=A0A7G5C1C3_9BACL|nr:PQQ-dependent sugar dehydrogenase [Cohnella cholangitidis]QMV43007.1 PQQ-dependent sugar dehydrogenase [Cohnella cholangitidis]